LLAEPPAGRNIYYLKSARAALYQCFVLHNPTQHHLIIIYTECLWYIRNHFRGCSMHKNNKQFCVNMGPSTLRLWVTVHFIFEGGEKKTKCKPATSNCLFINSWFQRIDYCLDNKKLQKERSKCCPCASTQRGTLRTSTRSKIPDVLQITGGAVALVCLPWRSLLHCVSWNIVMWYIVCMGGG
jgi:hypothetical protein